MVSGIFAWILFAVVFGKGCEEVYGGYLCAATNEMEGRVTKGGEVEPFERKAL